MRRTDAPQPVPDALLRSLRVVSDGDLAADGAWRFAPGGDVPVESDVDEEAAGDGGGARGKGGDERGTGRARGARSEPAVGWWPR